MLDLCRGATSVKILEARLALMQAAKKHLQELQLHLLLQFMVGMNPWVMGTGKPSIWTDPSGCGQTIWGCQRSGAAMDAGPGRSDSYRVSPRFFSSFISS